MPGDFDREQAEEVIRWADSILDEPLTMPVCMAPRAAEGARDYIVKQIELQREVHDDDDQVFPLYGEQLGQLVREDREFATGDRGYCLDMISAISGAAGLPLRAQTRARIDSECNLDIPRRLTMLAAIKNDELRFSELRKRILETPDSWPLLLVKPKAT